MYIALVLTGLVLVHVGDPVSIKRIRFVKPLVWAVGLGLIIYGAVMASLNGTKFNVYGWAVVAGWFFFVISGAVVLISLFINLPFRRTYVSTGTGDRLVTTGLYSLTRHPGVLSTIALVGSVILISRSYLVLLAAPLVIALDFLLVTLQDRLFFGRMFEGYVKYRNETPMFVPNSRSIRAFAAWLRQALPSRCTKGATNDFQLG